MDIYGTILCTRFLTSTEKNICKEAEIIVHRNYTYDFNYECGDLVLCIFKHNNLKSTHFLSPLPPLTITVKLFF